MKLIIIILFTTLMQVSASTFGQKVTLAERNASLEKVFQKMRQQTGYDFLFDAEVVKLASPVNINVSNAPLSEALELCLKNQNLDFTIEEKSVIVSRAKEKGFLDNLIARFQSIDVRGKVVDSLGNGLAGATVSVKGGKQSTQTAANGDFNLKNVEEGAVLVISYLGYVTKEQVVGKEFNYIRLQISTSKLDEVQVIAYGTTSRRLSTGSITTVKSEDLGKQPVNNLLLALQGRIPNLSITPASGLPGSQIKLQLRGQNSFGGNSGGVAQRSEPLIVVDGIPITNNVINGSFVLDYNAGQQSALSFISPNDIESIDVLSDGDATSIFGSRGASGVIMVTTKKGKKGKTSINFSVNTGFSDMNRRLSLLNNKQYLEMRRQAFKNDGLPIPDAATPAPERNALNYDLTVWDPNRNTDWQEQILGGAAKQNELYGSISGGTDLVQYLINGNYNHQGYLFPGDSKSESGSGHMNITGRSPNNRFDVSVSGDYFVNNTKNAGFNFMGVALGMAPNAPSIYTEEGKLNWAYDNETGLSTWSNPYANLANVNTSRSDSFRASGNIGYKFSSNLSFRSSFGYSQLKNQSFSPITLESKDPSLSNLTAEAAHNNMTSSSFTIDPQIIARSNISQGKFQALLGSNWQGQTNSYQTINAYGYTSDSFLRDLSKAAFGQIFGNSGSSQYKSISAFGRLNYNWKDKYILNVSARRDGSSRFGPQNKFGNYWSVAGAWLFSNERFLKNSLPFLSFGKLRSSYGSNGNDAIGDYQYIELFETVPADETYQGIRPIKSRGVINPYYSWEDVRKAEIAIEMGFLNDKVLFSAAYFQNRSSNQLGTYQLPATAGGTSILINQGAKIQNYGWEFTVNTRNIDSKNFNWSTSFNLGIKRNKLLSLPESFLSIPYAVSYYKLKDLSPIGHSFDGIVPTYEYRGVNQETGVYQFSNNDGGVAEFSYEANQYAKLLNVLPNYSGGLNNTIKYGFFSVDFFFQFTKQMGRNFIFDDAFTTPGITFESGLGANRPIEILNRWQTAGDKGIYQKFSSVFWSDAAGAYDLIRQSDLAWVDASFIKLKNVSISFSAPGKWKDVLHLQNVTFQIRGSNLFTLTKYKGLDPETQSVSALPQLRTITAGLQVGF